MRKGIARLYKTNAYLGQGKNRVHKTKAHSEGKDRMCETNAYLGQGKNRIPNQKKTLRMSEEKGQTKQNI